MSEIPTGYCQCGCGGRAPLAKWTSRREGTVRGEPCRFIVSHNSRRRKGADRWRVEDRGHDTPCWIWQLSERAGGYGQVRLGAKTVLAHRLVYEEHRGPIPPGFQLDHLCRQRGCVNPDHLEPVTCAENLHRGRGTRLTEAIVEEIRSLVAGGWVQADIARAYAVSQGHISRIGAGEVWAGV